MLPNKTQKIPFQVGIAVKKGTGFCLQTEDQKLYRIHPWDLERLKLKVGTPITGQLFHYQQTLNGYNGLVYPGTLYIISKNNEKENIDN